MEAKTSLQDLLYTPNGVNGVWAPVREIVDLNDTKTTNTIALQATLAPAPATTVAAGTAGACQQIVSVSAAESVVKTKDGRLYSNAAVSFVRNMGDPLYAGTRIWFTGYNGNAGAQLMSEAHASPCSVECLTTGETVTITAQAVSSDGTPVAFDQSPTCTIILNGIITAPPAPNVIQQLVPLPLGLQFTFEQLHLPDGDEDVIALYRVYKNSMPDVSGATLFRTFTADPNNLGSIVVQDMVGAGGYANWYWVSAVNTSGYESVKTPAQVSTVYSGLASLDGDIADGKVFFKSTLANNQSQHGVFLETFEKDIRPYFNLREGAWPDATCSFPTDGVAGGKTIQSSGYVWAAFPQNIAFDPDKLYRIETRYRKVSGSGASTIYVGLEGIAADGVSLVNFVGDNSHLLPHSFAVNGVANPPLGVWQVAVTYFKGSGAHNSGYYGAGNGSNPNDPNALHPLVRYIRPMFILNYYNGTDTWEIDEIAIDLLPNGLNGIPDGGLILGLDDSIGAGPLGWTPVTNTTDGPINFGTTVPGSFPLPGGVNSSYTYARWYGYLVPSVSGIYSLGVNSDDGCNLYLGNTNIVAALIRGQGANNTPTYTQSKDSIGLTAGRYYPIVLEWQQGVGGYECQLLWTPPGASTPQVVPSSCLSTSTSTVTGSLYGSWWNGTAALWYPTGAAWVDMAQNLPNKTMDNINDGAVYGRVNQNAITGGSIDMAKSGVVGKSVELMRSPNFEAGDRDWTRDTPWVIINDPANAYNGTWCAAYSGISAAAIRNSILIPAVAGDVFKASCLAKRTAGDGGIYVRFSCLNTALAEIGFLNGSIVNSAAYQTSSVTGAAPAGTAFMRVEAVAFGSTQTTTCYIDQFLVSMANDLDGTPNGSVYRKPIGVGIGGQFTASTVLNAVGNIAPSQQVAFAAGYTSNSVTYTLISTSLLRVDGSALNISGSATYTGLASTTTFYLYPYLDVATGALGMANPNPPQNSGSTTYAVQAGFDGRVPLPPVQITTSASGGGGGGGFTGGGDTCPEAAEWVALLDKGNVPCGQVQVGDFILGRSFSSGQDIYRQVVAVSQRSCHAWRMVDGHRVSPCEAIWDVTDESWKPAYRVTHSSFDDYLGMKVQITVASDDYNESNYYLTSGEQLLVHNLGSVAISPC